MRVIITGGSGLIGRALTDNLIANRHEVVILSRNPDQVRDLPVSVKVIRWDGASADGWGHLADGAKAIVNLAGESIADGRWTDERKRQLYESRIKAGQAVVEAVKTTQVKPSIVLQASAVGYYGPRNGQEILEDTPPGNDFLAQLCVDWETSTAPVEELGVRRVILRTGIVLSTAGGALPRMLLPFKMFAGGPLGSGQQWFPWIHLADEVAAIRFLMEHPQASGPFNLTAPQPLTNAQFGRILGRVIGRPALMPTPSLALKLAFGEMSTVLLDGQQATPHRLQELGFKFNYPQAEPALKELVG
jgi:uncharacterized protein (TIGR01777 family)